MPPSARLVLSRFKVPPGRLSVASSTAHKRRRCDRGQAGGRAGPAVLCAARRLHRALRAFARSLLRPRPVALRKRDERARGGSSMGTRRWRRGRQGGRLLLGPRERRLPARLYAAVRDFHDAHLSPPGRDPPLPLPSRAGASADADAASLATASLAAASHAAASHAAATTASLGRGRRSSSVASVVVRLDLVARGA